MKRRHATLEARLAANSEPELIVAQLGPCWLWIGRRNADGYGLINFWIPGTGSRHKGAHKVAAELAKGPCPPGCEWHHRCQMPACIRPDHLEAVPVKVNRATYRERRRQQRHLAEA